MVNRSYAKGRRFEYKTLAHLRKLGYFCIRQGKSAFPDIIAIKNGDNMLVECKVKKYLSADEKQKFADIRNEHEIKTFVAYPEQKKHPTIDRMITTVTLKEVI